MRDSLLRSYSVKREAMFFGHMESRFVAVKLDMQWLAIAPEPGAANLLREG
jgi:hypothetical protein